MTEAANYIHQSKKRSLIYEFHEEELYTNIPNAVFDSSKFNSRPTYTTDNKNEKAPRKKQTLAQSSFTTVKTIYKQNLKADLLKKKKKALATQNSNSIGTPVTARRDKDRRTMTLEGTPKQKINDLFDLRISPIRSSKENSILVPKVSSPKYMSIQEMHSLEIQNRSLNARKKRYIPTAKILDSSFRTRPYPPEFSHFISLQQDDSFSKDSDIKFFSQNNSINQNNSSFMSSNIASNDSSILGDLSSQDISQSSLKTRRKLKLSRNHIWLNALKNGIVTPNSNILPDDIKVALKTDEQKARNKRTLETIEHDDRENDSPNANNGTGKGFHKKKTPTKGAKVTVFHTLESRVESPRENRFLIQARRHTEESRTAILEKLKERSLSRSSLKKPADFFEERSIDRSFDKSRDRSQDRSHSLPQSVHDIERLPTHFTPEQGNIIEVALNNIKAPLPDSKFQYKLVSEKHYDNSLAKLQKIKALFFEFKRKFEENKLTTRPKETKQKKTPLKEIRANSITHTEESKDVNQTHNTSVMSTEENDPAKDLAKAKVLLKKKNDALKYMKYHYVKIKKKNLITAFNMIARLTKRKVFKPAFQELLNF